MVFVLEAAISLGESVLRRMFDEDLVDGMGGCWWFIYPTFEGILGGQYAKSFLNHRCGHTNILDLRRRKKQRKLS